MARRPLGAVFFVAISGLLACDSAEKKPVASTTTRVPRPADAAPIDEVPWWARQAPCPDGSQLHKSEAKRSFRCLKEDGTYHGPMALLFDGGQKRVEGRYVKGRRDGIWSQWNREGELLGTYAVDNGTGVVRDWFDSGDLRLEITMRDGKRNGPYLEWHPGRKLRWQRAYQDDLPQGGWQQWAVDGTLLGSLTFSNGTGRFTEWNDDGTVAVKGAYRRGKHHGRWQWFSVDDEAGKVVTTEYRREYRNGEVVSLSVFRDGELVPDESDPVPAPHAPHAPSVPQQTTPVRPPATFARLPRVGIRIRGFGEGLGRQAINRGIERHRLIRCYSEALATDPDLRGKLDARFQISATGEVTRARARGPGGPSFSRCLVDQIESLTFPVPEGGVVVDVAVTLEFDVVHRG